MIPRKLLRAGIGNKRKYKNVNSNIPKSSAFFYKPDISAHPLSLILNLPHKKTTGRFAAVPADTLETGSVLPWLRPDVQNLSTPTSVPCWACPAPLEPAGVSVRPRTPSQSFREPIPQPSTPRGAGRDSISQERPAGFIPSRKNAQQVPLRPLQLSGRCEQNFLSHLNRTSWQLTGSTEERKGFGKRQEENNPTATCRNYSVPVLCV